MGLVFLCPKQARHTGPVKPQQYLQELVDQMLQRPITAEEHQLALGSSPGRTPQSPTAQSGSARAPQQRAQDELQRNLVLTWRREPRRFLGGAELQRTLVVRMISDVLSRAGELLMALERQAQGTTEVQLGNVDQLKGQLERISFQSAEQQSKTLRRLGDFLARQTRHVARSGQLVGTPVEARTRAQELLGELEQLWQELEPELATAALLRVRFEQVVLRGDSITHTAQQAADGLAGQLEQFAQQPPHLLQQGLTDLWSKALGTKTLLDQLLEPPRSTLVDQTGTLRAVVSGQQSVVPATLLAQVPDPWGIYEVLELDLRVLVGAQDQTLTFPLPLSWWPRQRTRWNSTPDGYPMGLAMFRCTLLVNGVEDYREVMFPTGPGQTGYQLRFWSDLADLGVWVEAHPVQFSGFFDGEYVSDLLVTVTDHDAPWVASIAGSMIVDLAARRMFSAWGSNTGTEIETSDPMYSSPDLMPQGVRRFGYVLPTDQGNMRYELRPNQTRISTALQDHLQIVCSGDHADSLGFLVGVPDRARGTTADQLQSVLSRSSQNAGPQGEQLIDATVELVPDSRYAGSTGETIAGTTQRVLVYRHQGQLVWGGGTSGNAQLEHATLAGDLLVLRSETVTATLGAGPAGERQLTFTGPLAAGTYQYLLGQPIAQDDHWGLVVQDELVAPTKPLRSSWVNEPPSLQLNLLERFPVESQVGQRVVVFPMELCRYHVRVSCLAQQVPSRLVVQDQLVLGQPTLPGESLVFDPPVQTVYGKSTTWKASEFVRDLEPQDELISPQQAVHVVQRHEDQQITLTPPIDHQNPLSYGVQHTLWRFRRKGWWALEQLETSCQALQGVFDQREFTRVAQQFARGGDRLPLRQMVLGWIEALTQFIDQQVEIPSRGWSSIQEALQEAGRQGAVRLLQEGKIQEALEGESSEAADQLQEQIREVAKNDFPVDPQARRARNVVLQQGEQPDPDWATSTRTTYEPGGQGG